MELNSTQRFERGAPEGDAVVGALVGALAARDPMESGHNDRVCAYARALAERIDPGILDDPAIEAGFRLHDVGKMALPDNTLRRRGPLSARDWKLIQRHTVIGEEMVAATGMLPGAGAVVRSHHERWDGHGYPDRLRGEAIPLPARIFAVADAFDAITTDRPYRAGGTIDQAREKIAADAGAHFDPRVVSALDAVPDAELERIRT
jgi:ribonuclease P protein subunit RPR2